MTAIAAVNESFGIGYKGGFLVRVAEDIENKEL